MVAPSFALGFALAVITSGVGCGGDDGERWVSPEDRGVHLAGTLVDWVEVSRGETLDLQVWYPVAESDGEEQPFNYEVFAATEGQVVEEGVGACDTPRPVVMFSHGNSGINYQTYTMAEHLARHGYVVAAPNHVLNTAFDMQDDLRRAMCLWRPGDISESFDFLVSLSQDPSSPLHGCVDPAAGYAVMGHSFGAWTSLAVSGAPLDMRVLDTQCEGSTAEECDIIRTWIADHPGQDLLDLSDDRVWASVPLAPAWQEIFGDRLSDIQVPILVVGGELDVSTTWVDAVDPTYRGLAATPRYLVGLEGAGHYSFTDFCDIILMLGWDGDGCGPGFRPVQDVLATLSILVTAFLETTRGDARAAEFLPPAEGIVSFESVESAE
jgi:predicted dienelactone hydrolase